MFFWAMSPGFILDSILLVTPPHYSCVITPTLALFYSYLSVAPVPCPLLAISSSVAQLKSTAAQSGFNAVLEWWHAVAELGSFYGVDMEIEDQSETWYLITNINSPRAVWIHALAWLNRDLEQSGAECGMFVFASVSVIVCIFLFVHVFNSFSYSFSTSIITHTKQIPGGFLTTVEWKRLTCPMLPFSTLQQSRQTSARQLH